MKRNICRVLSVLLMLLIVISLASCNEKVEKEGVWESASYLKDTTLGKGEKTFMLEVKADDELIVFTINTDKTILGDALLEHELISGEESQYGLYVKKVNGILADYDIDGSYWAFYIDGEYALTGVDSTEITEGAVYRLERAK